MKKTNENSICKIVKDVQSKIAEKHKIDAKVVRKIESLRKFFNTGIIYKKIQTQFVKKSAQNLT